MKGLVTERNYGNTIYNDPLKTALGMEHFLKEEMKCNLVVCLSHLGLRYRENRISDMIVAQETLLTDLIIGGHTPFLTGRTHCHEKQIGERGDCKPCLVGGLMVGKIDYVFERSGKRKKAAFSKNLNA
jgi:5'-nucleotidase